MRKRTNRIIVLMMVICLAASMTLSVDAYSGNAPFGNTGYNSYTHNDKFKGYLMVDGVDVSEYQSANSDWTTAKKNNVDFTIIRATWTGYSTEKHSYEHVDDNFKSFYQNAKAAGQMVGIYGFSQATTEDEARAEADYLVTTLEDAGVKTSDLMLPVYMDYEFAGPSSGAKDDMRRMHYYKTHTDSTHAEEFTKTLATECARAYCNVIREAGYQPGIYANTSFFNDWLNASSIESDVDLWCAQYYSENESPVNYTKWQFTSTANIKGVLSSSGSIGSTDANFWYIKKNPTSTDPTNLASCTVYGATDYNYTDSAISPKFDIYNTEGELLTAGTDYAVGYVNNIVKGTQQAYAYIRGAGEYKGYLLIPFTIGSGYISHIGLTTSESTESGFIVDNYKEEEPEEIINEPQEEVLEEPAEEVAEEPAVESMDEEIVAEPEEGDTETQPVETSPYELINYGFGISQKRIVVSQDNLKVGNFLAGLQIASECEGYTLVVVNSKGVVQADEAALVTGMILQVKDASGSVKASADIAVENDSIKNRTGKDPSRPLLTVSLKTTSYYYDGNAKKPGVVVKYNGSTFADGVTASNTNVAVSYASGCKKPGTYKVTVTGKTCPGKKSASFTIKVKPTTISKLSRGKKAFTVKVSKQASKYVTGYQVRYSLKSNMSGSKTKTIGTKYKTVKKKISKLKKNKTYYVQVRSYKKISGKKYYSSWSAVKKVKTK